jgi:hypothetical protein
MICRTRQQLATELGLSDARSITGYIARGMPRLADGSFDVDACRAWQQRNIVRRGGNCEPQTSGTTSTTVFVRIATAFASLWMDDLDLDEDDGVLNDIRPKLSRQQKEEIICEFTWSLLDEIQRHACPIDKQVIIEASGLSAARTRLTTPRPAKKQTTKRAPPKK